MTYRIDQSPSRAVAVTPSDTAEISLVGFYVGGAGNVSVIPENPTLSGGNPVAVVLNSVPAGAYINLRVRRINSTGTTATNIVGFAA